MNQFSGDHTENVDDAIVNASPRANPHVVLAQMNALDLIVLDENFFTSGHIISREYVDFCPLLTIAADPQLTG